MSFAWHRGTEGNCGITEFYSFDGERNCDWMKNLAQNFKEELDAYYDTPRCKWPGIVLFSGTKERDPRHRAPHKFAAWLRRQGEQVTATPWSQNDNHPERGHKHKIKAYLWHPSRQFRGKFNRYCEAKKISMKPEASPWRSDY